MIEEKENSKKEKNKKTLIVSIVGVLVLVIAVVGISFAAWNYVFNGTLTNTLSTADISLELLESDDNVIAIENALPMSDNEGKAQQQVFDFVVTSKTTRDIDIDYTVTLGKLDVDNGYTSLNDNQIKLYLTDEAGTAIWNSTNNVKKVSDLSNYVITKGQHSHDSTHNKVQDKYRLRVWIDSDVDASSWNAETKLQYKFRIWINGGEHVPSAYPEYVYRYGTNVVGLGNMVESVTGTKWIVKANGEENDYINQLATQNFGKYYWDTHQECTTAITNMGYTEGQETPLGTIACAEKEGTFGGFDYTENYTTLNKTFFLGHKIGNDGKVERNDAYFIRNNTLYCLKGVETANAGYDENNPAPYYGENYNTLLEAFGPNAIENNVCSVYVYYIYCSASGLTARADMYGGVNADVDSAGCSADTSGSSGCNE